MRSEWAFFCAAVRRRGPRFLGCCESESAVAAALGLPLPRACNSAISASIRLRCACSPAIANSISLASFVAIFLLPLGCSGSCLSKMVTRVRRQTIYYLSTIGPWKAKQTWGRKDLPAFEYWFTFFEEGFNAFILVFRRETQCEQIYFATQTFVKICARCDFYRFLREPHCN